jgi:hypothetical protein
MIKRPITITLAALALAGLLGACSSDGGTEDGDAGAGDPNSDEAAAPDQTAAAGWEKVVPGGDCQCADGGEFAGSSR